MILRAMIKFCVMVFVGAVALAFVETLIHGPLGPKVPGGGSFILEVSK